MAGINKILNFSNTVSGFKKIFFLKLPNIVYNLIIIGVIILEIVGPLIIVYSFYNHAMYKLAYYSCILLALFTVAATLLYHFPPKGAEYYFFMKNMSIIGGLLFVSLSFGPFN
tara:strand:- start:88 stop:426 length:339 start_codon:yes stop_codon:yes gene_type:complete